VKSWVNHITKRKKAAQKLACSCNAGFDLGWIKTELGIKLPDGKIINDIGAQAMLIDENRRRKPGQKSRTVSTRSAKWCGVEMKDEKALIEAAARIRLQGRGRQEVSSPSCPGATSARTPSRTRARRFCRHEHMRPQIAEHEMDRRVRDLEMQLVPMVHAMRKRGVRINESGLGSSTTQLMGSTRRAAKDIRHHEDAVSRGHRRDSAAVVAHQGLRHARHRRLSRVTDYKEGEAETEFGKNWMRASQHPLAAGHRRGEAVSRGRDEVRRGYLMLLGLQRAHPRQHQPVQDRGRRHALASLLVLRPAAATDAESRPDPVEGWLITERSRSRFAWRSSLSRASCGSRPTTVSRSTG
jgi:hypothetical protein